MGPVCEVSSFAAKHKLSEKQTLDPLPLRVPVGRVHELAMSAFLIDTWQSAFEEALSSKEVKSVCNL